MSFSRRDFLKGATFTAAGVAMAGILGGCSNAGPANAPADSAAPARSTQWYDEEFFKKPAPITDIAEKIDVDVAVVGAGNGGCIAAVSAADLGAKVAWVEQNAGTITWAGEIAALNSKVAKENFGVSYTEEEKNMIVNDICRYASYEVDQRLVSYGRIIPQNHGLVCR